MRSLKLRVGTSGEVAEPHDDDIGTDHAGGPRVAPAVAGSGFIESSRLAPRIVTDSPREASMREGQTALHAKAHRPRPGRLELRGA